MSQSGWCDRIWQLVVGCSYVSEGCKHCYSARKIHNVYRDQEWAKELTCLNRDGVPGWTGKVVRRPEQLFKLDAWDCPSYVLVGDRGDLLHPKVPDEFIERALIAIENNPKNIYLLLTKRSERMASFFGKRKLPDNLWLGVSVEKSKYLHRVDDLHRTGAKKKFLSLQPLLGPVPVPDVDWVIVGGQQGGEQAATKLEWVEQVVEQAKAKGIPLYVNYLPGYKKLGFTTRDWPEYLQVWERPSA